MPDDPLVVSGNHARSVIMARMITWTGIGFVVGFAVFLGLFWTVWSHQHEPDRLIPVAFSLMGAIPVAVIGSIFSGVSVIKDEFDKLRREMMRMQGSGAEITIHDKPSTQFKPGATRD